MNRLAVTEVSCSSGASLYTKHFGTLLDPAIHFKPGGTLLDPANTTPVLFIVLNGSSVGIAGRCLFEVVGGRRKLTG